MKKITFVFIAVLTVLILTGCPGVGSDPVTYAIGDTGPSGVGLVFYITDGGLHGLEAALNTWSGGTEDPEAQWGDYDVDIPGLDNMPNSNADTLAGTVGFGEENTSVIVTHMESKSITGTAAQICADYTGGAKKDWFLPSAGELDLMYTNLYEQGIGGFTGDGYWTSSERNAGGAWRLPFLSTGVWSFVIKNGNVLVRPVRDF